VRRIAPPPPADFVVREEGPRYSHSPPPSVRRVAPPRSPSATPPGRRGHEGDTRTRGGHEDWADPWMRSREEKSRVLGPAGRRRSYSSGSSRSSSSGSSRSRSPPPKHRYSSSSRSSSRSRSSTPPGIPRRRPPQPKEHVAKNTAPLQKRLAGVATPKAPVSKAPQPAASRPLLVPKVEPDSRERKPVVKARSSSSSSHGSPPRRRQPQPAKPTQRNDPTKELKEASSVKSKEIGTTKEVKAKEPAKVKDTGPSKPKESSKSKEPFKMNISVPKNQIKLTLKTSHTAKPANQTVLEKLGMTNEDLVEAQKGLKRKAGEGQETPKKKGQENQENATKKKKVAATETAEKRKVAATEPVNSSKIVKAKVVEKDKTKLKDVKEKKKKSATDAQSRREELLKQLKAVEDAITRKRTKLEK